MSGSFGKSRSRQGSQQRVWDAQAPYLQDLYSRASGLSQQPAMNAYQVQGQNMALAQAGQIGSGIAQPAQSALNFGLTAPNVGQNPYIGQAVRGAVNPMIDAFREDILPSIGRNAEMAGQYGGSRQAIAEGIAAGKLMRNIGDVSSRMYSDAYGQGLSTMINSLQAAPSIAGLAMMPSQIVSDVGDAQQLAPWMQLQRLGGLLGNPVTLGSSYGRSDSVNFSRGM